MDPLGVEAGGVLIAWLHRAQYHSHAEVHNATSKQGQDELSSGQCKVGLNWFLILEVRGVFG